MPRVASVRLFPYLLLVRVPLLANLLLFASVLQSQDSMHSGVQRISNAYFLLLPLELFAIPLGLIALLRARQWRSWPHWAALACGGVQLVWMLEVFRRLGVLVDQ